MRARVRPYAVGHDAEDDAADRRGHERGRPQQARRELAHAQVLHERGQHERVEHHVEAVEHPAEAARHERAAPFGRAGPPPPSSPLVARRRCHRSASLVSASTSSTMAAPASTARRRVTNTRATRPPSARARDSASSSPRSRAAAPRTHDVAGRRRPLTRPGPACRTDGVARRGRRRAAASRASASVSVRRRRPAALPLSSSKMPASASAHGRSRQSGRAGPRARAAARGPRPRSTRANLHAVAGCRLRQAREVDAGDRGDLGVAAGRAPVGHQHDGHAVAADLDGSERGAVRHDVRAGAVRDPRGRQPAADPVGLRRHRIGLRQERPDALVGERIVLRAPAPRGGVWPCP